MLKSTWEEVNFVEKGKRMIALLVSFVLLMSLACPVFAADMQPYYVGDGTVSGTISRSAGAFSARATTKSRANKIEVTATLYEKGLIFYSQVASSSNSGSGTACTASGSYSYQSGKTYKLEYSATFYYADGTSETVNGSVT